MSINVIFTEIPTDFPEIAHCDSQCSRSVKRTNLNLRPRMVQSYRNQILKNLTASFIVHYFTLSMKFKRAAQPL